MSTEGKKSQPSSTVAAATVATATTTTVSSPTANPSTSATEVLASQKFCVRWNGHLGSLGAAFPQLLAGQRFVDVTLACDGHQLRCHRLVLAACSAFFESLLNENPCKHPIIILPRDIRLWEIQALVDFMYKGEVNVSQDGLTDLLKCAEFLQIRGLFGSDAASYLNEMQHSHGQKSGTSQSTSSVKLTNGNLATAQKLAPSTYRNERRTSKQFSKNCGVDEKQQQSPISKRRRSMQTGAKATGQTSPEVKQELLSSGDDVMHQVENSSMATGHVDYEELIGQTDDSQQRSIEDADSIDTTLMQIMAASLKNEINQQQQQQKQKQLQQKQQQNLRIIPISKVKTPTTPTTSVASDERRQKRNNNATLRITPTTSLKLLREYYDDIKNCRRRSIRERLQQEEEELREKLRKQETAIMIRRRDNENEDDEDNDAESSDNDVIGVNNQRIMEENQKYDEDNEENRTIVETEMRVNKNFIRVSNEKTNENQQQSNIRTENCIDGISPVRKQSLRIFNRKRLAANNAMRLAATNRLNNSLPTTSKPEFRISSPKTLNSTITTTNIGKIRVKSTENLFDKRKFINQNSGNNEIYFPPLKYNRNAMSIFLKNPSTDEMGKTFTGEKSETFEIKTEDERSLNNQRQFDDGEKCGEYNSNSESETQLNYENIICSPTISAEFTIPPSTSANILADGSPISSRQQQNLQLRRQRERRQRRQRCGSLLIGGANICDYDDVKMDNADLFGQEDILGEILKKDRIEKQNELLQLSIKEENIDNDILMFEQETYESSQRDQQFLNSQCRNFDVINPIQITKTTNVGDGNKTKLFDGVGGVQIFNVENPEAVTTSLPTLSAVVLRNPRSNQPRNYSNDALYAALMDVKSGESIYRASQLHKVPRKTLRNWMKRWHIKSAYPMPRQLKQAAEKKRLVKQIISEATAASATVTTNNCSSINRESSAA